MNTLKTIANNHETVFTHIYKSKKWGGKDSDSVSGPGSDVLQTAVISKKFPHLFTEFGIATMLDIPCGDFHWMKNVELGAINYTGADIVEALINGNTKQYADAGKHFQKLNITEDKLPKVDLIFCRDGLVHFSFADIFHALNNICDSRSEYLLTTTFPARKNNKDIATGKWRTLNMTLAPFMLPKPLHIINEGCTQSAGAFKDKSLGLWKISDIRKSLINSNI
jgi:hypothetical protein